MSNYQVFINFGLHKTIDEMPLLPNAGSAVVPIEKLRDYALNPEHPVGKHKAKVFEAVLGLTVSDAVFLQEKILEAVLTNDAMLTRHDEYGQRYTVEFELTPISRTAVIMTSWILSETELAPRLTSCYVK